MGFTSICPFCTCRLSRLWRLHLNCSLQFLPWVPSIDLRRIEDTLFGTLPRLLLWNRSAGDVFPKYMPYCQRPRHTALILRGHLPILLTGIRSPLHSRSDQQHKIPTGSLSKFSSTFVVFGSLTSVA